MRKTIGVLVVLLAMSLGARLAGAQMIDPSTGIMVDAATDPMDFSAIMSGQPTNFGLEAALSANAQAQAAMEANTEAADAASQSSMDAMNAANASDDTPVAQPPALPNTPKPVITPAGGTFKGSVQVTIADGDGAAAVFYTTDGKKPTTSSPRYVGPIVVATKTKVEALAFDVNMQPSAVVSKTFKVKAQ
ncbi:MAG: chitobiase/beta-hexosaminidase C-terminal domain-containing protein [Acidobacteriaceae bacterium]